MLVIIKTQLRVSEQSINSAFQKFLQQAVKTDLNYCLYKEGELDLMLEKFQFGAHKDPDSDYNNDTEDSQKKEFDVLCKHNEKCSLCHKLDFKEQRPPV